MKITNLLIYIVLGAVFIALFSHFLSIGTNEYDRTVDEDLQETLDELKEATQNDEVIAVTSALDTDNTTITDEGVGEILQFKKASSLITTVRSVKPVVNTMFTSISEYLEIPIFIKVAFGMLLGIGFLSFGVYLILRVKV